MSKLFEAPLEEFIARRNELAKAAKNPEDAKRIKAFRKPSKALWLVNDVARREPAQVKALISATARVRKAQEKGASGDELREAMREQRQALAALTEAAGDESVERRVHDTLQAAAMANPSALREARIEEELQPAGFDAVFGLDIAPRPAHGGKPAKHEAAHRTAAHGRHGAKGGAAAGKREAEAKMQRDQELRAARREADGLAALAKKLEAAAERAESAAAKAAAAAAEAQRHAAELREKSDKASADAKAGRAKATLASLLAGHVAGA